jgi:hypothetical protein
MMKQLGRIFVGIFLLFLLIVLVPLVGVGLQCWSTVEAEAIKPAQVEPITADLTNYARPEDQTYLTLPEWYIVYSADEYADFISRNRPSHFPYFQAITQYWENYYAVCAVTRDRYPFNSDYHLTLAVIGTSFTVENILKGLYENTIGRLTEWLSSPELTEEDVLARQVAKEYGDFIHTIPWYEFPFGEKFNQLWQRTSWAGPNIIRKWERKMALSLEFGGKAFYAGLIKQGTQTAYAPEELEIQAWVEGLSDQILRQEPQVRLIKDINGQAAIAAIPRYEAFSQRVPELTQQGVRFVEIAGNDAILITLLSRRSWAYDLPAGEFLFSQPILTQPEQKRVAVKVPVTALHMVLNSLESRRLQLEHIYDY